ncbi:hypothetical protein DUI70_0463 [Streptomyces albus]|nr:hypothetical protein DUI70_0463 [Streptomyces albus]
MSAEQGGGGRELGPQKRDRDGARPGGVRPVRHRGKTVERTAAAAANLPEAVRENEEVVPVNVSTWVLSSGVTAGRKVVRERRS